MSAPGGVAWSTWPEGDMTACLFLERFLTHELKTTIALIVCIRFREHLVSSKLENTATAHMGADDLLPGWCSALVGFELLAMILRLQGYATCGSLYPRHPKIHARAQYALQCCVS